MLCLFHVIFWYALKLLRLFLYALFLPLRLVSADLRISFWKGPEKILKTPTGNKGKKWQQVCVHVYSDFVCSANQSHFLNPFQLGFLISAYISGFALNKLLLTVFLQSLSQQFRFFRLPSKTICFGCVCVSVE